MHADDQTRLRHIVDATKQAMEFVRAPTPRTRNELDVEPSRVHNPERGDGACSPARSDAEREVRMTATSPEPLSGGYGRRLR